MSSERTPIVVEHAASLCAEVQDIYTRIAAKAYEYFLEGGCINGHDVDDWLRLQ